MDEILITLTRTVFIYFFILVVMRIMGKREIAKLSVFDLVVFIIIAEVAAIGIEDVSKPLLEVLSPVLLVMILQMLFSYISMKKEHLRDFIEGKPSVLIENGKINDKEMQKQRYDIYDLIMQLHEQKVRSVADVEFAILETTGKLAVFTKEDSKQKPPSREKGGEKYNPPLELGEQSTQLSQSATIQTEVRFKGLPIILIADCKVKDESLQKIMQTRFWLKNKLQEAGFKEIKDVYFASVDEDGTMFIDGRDHK